MVARSSVVRRPPRPAKNVAQGGARASSQACESVQTMNATRQVDLETNTTAPVGRPTEAGHYLRTGCVRCLNAPLRARTYVEAVAAVSGRLEKVDRLAELLKGLSRGGGADRDRGALGRAAAGTARGRRRRNPQRAAGRACRCRRAHLHDVDAAFDAVARVSGAGAPARRVEHSSHAAGSRHGGGAGLPRAAALRRAAAGSTRRRARRGGRARVGPARRTRAPRGDDGRQPRARSRRPRSHDGPQALDRFAVRIFTPVQPMLRRLGGGRRGCVRDGWTARPSSTSSMARACRCTRRGDEVRVYSRNLHDVTAAVPEVVEVTRALPARGDHPRR